jgi:hypothetical protein
MDGDFRGDGVGETEIIRCRQTVDEHLGLIASREGIDYLATIWIGRPACERVDTRS